MDDPLSNWPWQIEIRRGESIHVMLVDERDYPWTSHIPWTIVAGYATWRRFAGWENNDPATGVRYVQHFFAHNLVLPTHDGYVVDHVNHNRLDNRRENLRRVTPRQNGENLPDRAGRDLPRGVSRRAGRYIARVNKGRRRYHGGTWDTVEEAQTAAIALRLRLFTHSDTEARSQT